MLMVKSTALQLRLMLFALSFNGAAISSLHAQTACERLLDLKLDGARILSAAEQPASDISATAVRIAAHAAAHCEVKGVATPATDSLIHFTVWLPAPARWNGKYLQKGSGGWGGEAYDYALITPLNRGYAAAVTDDGHVGDGTARFTIGHPEKLIDFGYRAIHETSRHARTILNAFYAKPQARAYFVGCSDGGREALMQAQRYPEDFDGIVAGAPANNWTHLMTAFVANEKALFAADGSSLLSPSKLRLLQNAALKACDAKDGVRDGIIDDPHACAFAPASLLCKRGEANDCLTTAQISAVEKVYAGTRDPVSQQSIYPGFEPGSEALASTWKPWLLDGTQAYLGNSNFADVIHQGRGWDWRTSDLHEDFVRAQQHEAPITDAVDPDLRRFRDHGGKLIAYHGWGDAAVAPQNSIDCYRAVERFVQKHPTKDAPGVQNDSAGFFRLFMVPGMSHCWDGAGPSAFGNEEVPAPGLIEDAEHDIVLALDRWVLQGIAPARIIATKLPATASDLNTVADAGTANVNLTRPLCAYPNVARYIGNGSTDAAQNFRCVAPASRKR
jgi:feruloyl esterase